MELMSILLDCNYKESEKMANITNYLNKIKTAVYGKDVRGAIHDAIKQVYDDASVNHDNANMEVKMARGTHNTLNDRLDKSEQKLDETNAQLSHIASDEFGIMIANKDTQDLQDLINNLDGKPLKLTKIYNINKPLICPNDLKIYSDKIQQGGITAIAEMDSILMFDQMSRASINNLVLNGNNYSKSGIFCKKIMEHSTIESNYITGTKENAILIIDGWCNDIVKNEIFLNKGNGITLSLVDSINIFNILQNKIYSNGNIGIACNGGSAININHNTIEKNELCGIMASATYGLNINEKYFESNGINGFYNIHCDIFLNGNSTVESSMLYPNKGVTIRDNITSADILSGNNIFIHNNASEILNIDSNTRYGNKEVKILSLNVDSGISIIKGLSINNNFNFGGIEIKGALNYALNIESVKSDKTILNNNIIKGVTYEEFTESSHVSGTQRLESTRKFNGKTGFSLSGINGTSSLYSKKINVNDYQDLKGKYIYFACTCYRENAECTPMLYVNGVGTNSYINPTIENDFYILSTVTKMPDDGEVEFSYGLFTTSTSAKCNFYDLCISEVGIKYIELI